MEQSMRNDHGVTFAERPASLTELTPTGRPKTYARHRTSGQALLRLKELQIDMARREVAQIEVLISDLDHIASTLESDIEAEQNRTANRDPSHFAYSMYARATIVRRDNLKRTLAELKDRLAVAKVTLAEALQDEQGPEQPA
jgi:hypothetical protein